MARFLNYTPPPFASTRGLYWPNLVALCFLMQVCDPGFPWNAARVNAQTPVPVCRTVSLMILGLVRGEHRRHRFRAPFPR